MPLLKRKTQTSFDLQVQDMLLRVSAPEEYYEESRAAAISVWEQLQSYSIRDPAFRTSKRPVEVPEDAPAVIREMAEAAFRTGVGPAFTMQGAVTDHVGRYLARELSEVVVSSGGDHFVHTNRRMKLVVHHSDDAGQIAVIVDPGRGVAGVSTTLGRSELPARTLDGLAVLATSCTLADAAAAAVLAILSRPNALKAALGFLQDVDGVQGGLLIKGSHIGVAGSVELAS